MSSDKRPSSGPSGPRGRRRPGRTIDLQATEIASTPVEGPKAAQQQAEEPAASQAPDAPGIQPTPEPPSAPEPQPQAGAEAPRQEAPSGASGPPPSRRFSVAWLPADVPWPLIGAAVVGAVLAVAAVSIAGLWSGRESTAGGLEPRLLRVEQQLRELAARPAPASADPKAVDDLTGRIARLEAAAANPRPAPIDPELANRLARLEGELRALGENISVLGRRSDEIGTTAREARQRADANAAALAELSQRVNRGGGTGVDRSEIEALTNRIAALEKRLSETAMEQRATGAVERLVRAAFAAFALKAAVERGEPFAAELAAAKALAADPKVLAPLEPFAAAGVPSAAALTRELAAVIPALAKAADTAPRDGSFLERLQANAGKLVRIRPIDEVPGDDPAAVIARIEARAAQSDPAGALAELAKLPAPMRAPAQAWIARAEARNAAVETSRRFAADALAGLGKP